MVERKLDEIREILGDEQILSDILYGFSTDEEDWAEWFVKNYDLDDEEY